MNEMAAFVAVFSFALLLTVPRTKTRRRLSSPPGDRTGEWAALRAAGGGSR